MGSIKGTTALTAVILIAAACGGSDESDQVSADVVAVDNTSVVSTREVTQVVVIGADAEAVGVIEAAMADYDFTSAAEAVATTTGRMSCSVA